MILFDLVRVCLILLDLVKFVVGSWPCVSCLRLFYFFTNCFKNPAHNHQTYAKINLKSIKNGAWERLGRVLETGWFQEPPQKRSPIVCFTHVGDIGRILGATSSHLAPNGCPRGPKWDQKSIKNQSQNRCKHRCRKRANNYAKIPKNGSKMIHKLIKKIRLVRERMILRELCCYCSKTTLREVQRLQNSMKNQLQICAKSMLEKGVPT